MSAPREIWADKGNAGDEWSFRGDWWAKDWGDGETRYVRADLAGWQPIETAPINTDVLVCWARSEGFNGAVCQAIHAVDGEDWYDAWRTEANPADGGEFFEWPETPTHWQPLPEPPDA